MRSTPALRRRIEGTRHLARRIKKRPKKEEARVSLWTICNPILRVLSTLIRNLCSGITNQEQTAHEILAEKWRNFRLLFRAGTPEFWRTRITTRVISFSLTPTTAMWWAKAKVRVNILPRVAQFIRTNLRTIPHFPSAIRGHTSSLELEINLKRQLPNTKEFLAPTRSLGSLSNPPW